MESVNLIGLVSGIAGLAVSLLLLVLMLVNKNERARGWIGGFASFLVLFFLTGLYLVVNS